MITKWLTDKLNFFGRVGPVFGYAGIIAIFTVYAYLLASKFSEHSQKQLETAMQARAAAQQKQTIQVLEKTAENVTASVENLQQAKVEIAQRHVLIERQVHRKVKQLQQEALEKGQDPVVTEQKISEVRLASLWEVYCGFNQNDRCDEQTAALK